MVKQKSALRLARMSKGLTLKEGANLLGISSQFLSSIELGYEKPSKAVAEAMEKLYK